MRTPTKRRRLGGVVLTASLLVTGLLGAGCTGDEGGDGDGPAGSPTGTARTGEREPALDVRVARVAGELGEHRRRRVTRELGDLVDRWFAAAYLGDYPRSSFAEAWPGFTPDAARQARRHRHLTSNAVIGRRLRSVDLVGRSARIDVLAHKGEQRAATVRFRLVFDATSKGTARHRVWGRLMTVRGTAGRWRVVGYDVRRSSRPVGGGR